MWLTLGIMAAEEQPRRTGHKSKYARSLSTSVRFRNGIPNAVPFSLVGVLCMISKVAWIQDSRNLEILLIHHLLIF